MREKTSIGHQGVSTKVGEKEVLIASIQNRMQIANRSLSSIRSYVRSVVRLYEFQGNHPKDLELDQVLDFLVYIKNEKGLHWRTIKLYVAGLRYYYQEIADDVKMASQIPYPKEKPSLPEVVSREELHQLFEGCKNFKHKVMFRLMYSAGLRRAELVNLKLSDIDTKDGKMRIRINNGKGGKDRYTVLSHTILAELRSYFVMCKPKIYLFNGRIKGEQMSLGGVRHALLEAVKNSGLERHINMHILRHCFASHALEDGLNIKTLQYLLGHQSVLTTMVYLHVSDVPLSKAFSPLDNWD
jgi:integrase/recombinase XerD